MRRIFIVGFALLGWGILSPRNTTWAQVPDLDRSDSAAEAEPDKSPYALPRSAPLRPQFGQAPEAEPSLYTAEPVSPEPVTPASGLEEGAATTNQRPQSARAPTAPAPPRSSSLAKTAGEKRATSETSSATGKSEEAANKEKNNSEPTDSLELPEFVPQPIRAAWNKVVSVWRYKVFMEVTVEKLSIGLVLLLVGYMAAKRISSWFATRVLGRLGIAKNNAATIQTIAFYALMAAFTLSTLGALGVPVTVFSFFGGALAVGIGFGSQNIVNNFISGLILLAERPIRVGDVIQIDGATGKVTEIGARSTRITTGANMEILVPNSTFLQTNVINWTLSDDVISSKVTVGVAYGSPARQVAKLLMQAADQNVDVLKEPAPGVSFTNFGDHSLEFELSFWLRLSQSDRGKVESELRFAIDDLFAEHGIIIAYPQRDVHLNLLRPVEVRLTPPAAGDVRRAAA